VNRDGSTWRAPRTVDARRKNRRDAISGAGDRPPAASRWRIERRSGMVRRLAASDSAARLAHVEGTQNLKRGRPDRTDRRSASKGEGNDGRRTDPARTVADAAGLARHATVRGQARRLHAEALREDRTPEPVGQKGHQKASRPTADDERTNTARSAQANKADPVECGLGKGRSSGARA